MIAWPIRIRRKVYQRQIAINRHAYIAPAARRISPSLGRKARSVVLDRWQPTMEQRQTKRSPMTLSMNIAPSSQPMKFLLSGSIKPSDMVVYPPESNERVQSGMEQRNAGQVQTSGPPILALTRTASISTTCLSHRGLMSFFICGTDIRCLLRTESNTSYSVLISTWQRRPSTLSPDSTPSKERTPSPDILPSRAFRAALSNRRAHCPRRWNVS
jgi:hypothetical protein